MTNTMRALTVVLGLLLAVCFAACGEMASTGAPSAETGPARRDYAPYETAVAAGAAAPTAAATAAPAAAFESHFSESAPEGMEAESSVDMLLSDSGSSPLVSLSAGEVDDNERWDDYLKYRDQYSGQAVHDVDISERYLIKVIDSLERPVNNAQVRVLSDESVLFEGRTYANGQTLFFPRAFPGSEGAEAFRLDVEKEGVSESLDVARNGDPIWTATLELDQAYSDGVALDVLFLLDATGSMSDEIDQIKDTLLSISARISDLPARPDLRFGMVAYRDRGDEFVTRLYDFDHDIKRFRGTIESVIADGGNDNPESLNEAYHVAIHEPAWRLGEAIRLVFLIADAPPHLDYANDYSYADEMMEAHRRGIKTFAIASSGLDQQGEYVFRQIAQHTMGRFIFIVYGPEGTTPHKVGQYTVENLDDLVVSLVEEELAFTSE